MHQPVRKSLVSQKCNELPLLALGLPDSPGGADEQWLQSPEHSLCLQGEIGHELASVPLGFAPAPGPDNPATTGAQAAKSRQHPPGSCPP